MSARDRSIEDAARAYLYGGEGEQSDEEFGRSHNVTALRALLVFGLVGTWVMAVLFGAWSILWPACFGVIAWPEISDCVVSAMFWQHAHDFDERFACHINGPSCPVCAGLPVEGEQKP